MNQAIAFGVLTGGLYAMMALGMSLSWGVLKVINLAQFSFILLSAYFTYQLAVSYGLSPFLAVFLCIPFFAAAGAALQWVFNRMRITEFESLLFTFGVFIMLESVMHTVWSADFRRLTVEQNPYQGMSWWIGNTALPVPLLAAFATALVVAIGTGILLSRSYFGRAVRAMAEDRDIAAAFGVDSGRVSMQLAALSGVFAGLAGIFIAMTRALNPALAETWFGIVFSVVILGGLGSTLGTFIAAIIVGVVGAIAAFRFGASSAPLAVFLVLIATLLFRPEGILGRRKAS